VHAFGQASQATQWARAVYWVAPLAFDNLHADWHCIDVLEQLSKHDASLPQRFMQISALSVHLEEQSPKFEQSVLFAHSSY
jgi:hypothetical protein